VDRELGLGNSEIFSVMGSLIISPAPLENRGGLQGKKEILCGAQDGEMAFVSS
jgi:hypothetical protein